MLILTLRWYKYVKNRFVIDRNSLFVLQSCLRNMNICIERYLCSAVKTQRSRWIPAASLRCGVELEGFEPSSKQGNHTLSTCLFRTSFFELRQDPDHQPQPYPLKLHRAGEAQRDYFRVNRTALPKSLGTTAFERCLVPSPGDGIKPVIYCTSIRQRERNLFRQINS